MFEYVDTDGGGHICIAEFKQLLHVPEAADEAKIRTGSIAGKVFGRILEHEKRANLLHVFHRFDPESSGGLDAGGFRQMMLALGIALSPSELGQVVEEMDRTGNGFISTKEFSDRVRLAKKDQRTLLRTSSARSVSPGRAASPSRRTSPGAAARSPARRTSGSPSPRGFAGAGFGSSSPRRL